MNPAILALEDGSVFTGQAFGAASIRTGEVVFNTSLTGYQEIFTDPSYAGQIVVLTNPQIGNYGTNPEDSQSKPWIEGLITRELSPLVSNWRSEQDAGAFLSAAGIPIGSAMDTRTLVRRLRMRGVMRGCLSTLVEKGGGDPDELVARARKSPSMAGLDLATRVSAKDRYTWDEPVPRCSPSDLLDDPAPKRFRVAAYDFGMKRDILRQLAHRGCSLTVVPAGTSAEDVLALKPDGVFLSNGPGDPEPLDYQAAQVRKLIGKTPVFGICLGHQVLGLALGGKTYKLKFGHRGGNHPVLNKRTNKVEITAQNHGFAVDPDTLNASDVDLTHVNLNDQTLEGIAHRRYPVFSVQYHPEAAPGPHDSHYLFDEFVAMMEAK
ncbi:MAG: glutamine-hydrolyzing carbamoyl-phosphate synthase small subunit [Bryobacteraceae bacterium]|nr:glutamine-hydrolyzing carbamoyl-phosphate synthase small subunit [Bryobacteraceae bacterium]